MFTDLSAALAHNPPARHYGVAAVDLGGAVAFVVAGHGFPNRVLAWDGGRLRDVAHPDLADADRQAIGVAAGDLDGDGREEIYVLNTDTYSGPKRHADRLFKARPDGGWDDLFARPENRPARNLAAGRSVAVIDRRGVGRYGFVVANYGKPMRLYELGPAGVLTDLAPPLGLALTTGGRGLLPAPLFGDATDLFCANEHGPNFLFRNLGDGTFEETATRHGVADPDEHGRGVTAVDAGGGRLGLCWGNWEGPHRLMARRPDGTFLDRATMGLAFPSAVRTVIAADFDNDGHDELFFNNIGEANRVFRLRAGGGGAADPYGAFETAMLDPGDALLPFGLGTGAAVADVDGDGVLELLIAHGESGEQPLSLFKARNAAGNGWLRVRPLTRFGAPARGATVRLESAGRRSARAVCGGSGYLCQMEPVAHFGLGPAPRADRVTVTWPDGAAVVLDDPGVNRTVVVAYPKG